jgi:hypothetical protein
MLYRWHIYQLRAKGKFLGVIEAPDEATAIKKAIELYDLREWQQNRLIARREA